MLRKLNKNYQPRTRILGLLGVTVLVFYSFIPPVLVSAQSDAEIHANDLHSIDYDTVWYDPDLVIQNECSSGELGSGVGPLTGSNNEQRAFNFLKSKGLTEEQAAGVVGNLIAESGVNPKVHQGHANLGPEPVDGVGFGIAQWTYSDRQRPLVQFAKELGEPTNSLAAQLGYLWKELNTTHSTAGKKVKAAGSLREASDAFLHDFEAPADQSTSVEVERAKLGEGVLKRYGTGSNGGGTDPISGACGQTDGTTVTIDGFTFPIITTKKLIKQGAEGATWCYASTSNCHHDYNAADIHVKTGAQVVAAKEGRVMSVTNSGTAAHLAIRSKDNGHLLFYQHLSAGSIPVREGQSVKGGAPIGKVGDRADAFGTAPHLHFDMLPSSYRSRVDCASAECKGYPFIDPQPVLNQLYQKLPDN